MEWSVPRRRRDGLIERSVTLASWFLIQLSGSTATLCTPCEPSALGWRSFQARWTLHTIALRLVSTQHLHPSIAWRPAVVKVDPSLWTVQYPPPQTLHISCVRLMHSKHCHS